MNHFKFALGLCLLSIFLLTNKSEATLNYNQYQKWTIKDQLYYSPLNEGENWRWKNSWNKSKWIISPVEHIELCAKYVGRWNYVLNQCFIEKETFLLEYIETLEFINAGGHLHPQNRLQNPPQTPSPEKQNLNTLNWSQIQNWSPEWQLYFSTFSE